MDIRHLRQFVAVAEELHFGRAATRLGMAQPPLSMAIRRLEDSVGSRLLTRTSRQVRLTAAGEVLLEEARSVLARLETALERTRQAATGRRGQLTLVFVANCFVLPTLLRAFRQSAPDVTIRLREATTAEQLADLAAGTADVGILRPPGDPPPGIVLERVLAQTLLLALPIDHPCADRETVALEDMAEADFVATVREKGAGYHDRVVGLCRRAGFVPRVVEQAIQMQTVLALVAAGTGVAVVPDSPTLRCHPEVALRRLSIAGQPSQDGIDLLMAWRADPGSPIRDRFVDVAREVMSAGNRQGSAVA